MFRDCKASKVVKVSKDLLDQLVFKVSKDLLDQLVFKVSKVQVFKVFRDQLVYRD